MGSSDVEDQRAFVLKRFGALLAVEGLIFDGLFKVLLDVVLHNSLLVPKRVLLEFVGLEACLGGEAIGAVVAFEGKALVVVAFDVAREIRAVTEDVFADRAWDTFVN